MNLSLIKVLVTILLHLCMPQDASTDMCPFRRPNAGNIGTEQQQLVTTVGSGSSFDRILHVAVCDTRSGWKEFQALKIWNVTGAALRDQGVRMSNVCKGEVTHSGFRL